MMTKGNFLLSKKYFYKTAGFPFYFYQFCYLDSFGPAFPNGKAQTNEKKV